MPHRAIELDALRFAYPGRAALLDIGSFTIEPGESVFLQGSSGSGKSTLLSLICGISAPVSGRVSVLDQDLAQLSAGGRDRFRANHLGIIFQQFNLLPHLSLTDNVTLSLRFAPERRARLNGTAPDAEAASLLSALGVDEPLMTPVAELSVGQQQRVAVARALLGSPDLLIADEPTSALDQDATDAFVELLLSRKTERTTVLFVSHDKSLARHFDRSLALTDLNGAARD
ncbi:MAG: ABC transporter ATP-binding protein [Pseudomonadota bacterium]